MILVGGFGLRFFLYDEDGPNLDRIYRRYFKGRVRKRYEEFNRTVGFIMIFVVALYGVFLVLNDLKPLSARFWGD